MEQHPVSVWKSSLSYGLFLGIALVLVSVIFYATGNTFDNLSQWMSYAVMIAGVVMAQLQFRKSQNNIMTYGQALGTGVLTMLFASVITSFFTYLLYAVIDPSLQEQLKLSIEEQIVKQGKVPDDQIELYVDMASRFQNPAIMFFIGIFGGAFIGLIISLMTSIVTQRKSSAEFSE
jgi:formate/nitrite transporter FocA (FNT family)